MTDTRKTDKELDAEAEKLQNGILWVFLLAIVVVAAVAALCRFVF